MYSFVNKAWIYSRVFFSGGRVCIKICLHSCILLIYNHLLEKAWQRLHYIYNTIQISPPLKMWKMILWKTDFFLSYLDSGLLWISATPPARGIRPGRCSGRPFGSCSSSESWSVSASGPSSGGYRVTSISLSVSFSLIQIRSSSTSDSTSGI